MSAGKVRVSADQIRDLITDVFIHHGVTADEARIQAGMLTEADLRGQHSHGIQRLPVLVGRILSGALAPGSTVQNEWLTPSVLIVDGGRGLGPVVAFRTLDALIEQAGRTGIALGLIRNSNHIGMLAPYVEEAARRGEIALVMTTSEALVHPWGGSSALVGTNPIGVGVPTEGEPFVLDMATAEVSIGKILSYAARGEPIPEGWAIDEHGRTTTDPDAVVAVSPFGGAKGYALGLAIELLVAGLTRTAFGDQVHGTLDTEAPATKGDLIVIISPQRLGMPELPRRVEEYLTQLRDSPRADPRVPVLIPGDRARAQRARSLDDGIVLDAVVWESARALRNPSPRVAMAT